MFSWSSHIRAFLSTTLFLSCHFVSTIIFLNLWTENDICQLLYCLVINNIFKICNFFRTELLLTYIWVFMLRSQNVCDLFSKFWPHSLICLMSALVSNILVSSTGRIASSHIIQHSFTHCTHQIIWSFVVFLIDACLKDLTLRFGKFVFWNA